MCVYKQNYLKGKCRLCESRKEALSAGTHLVEGRGQGGFSRGVFKLTKFEGGTLREKQQEVQRPGGKQQGVGEDPALEGLLPNEDTQAQKLKGSCSRSHGKVKSHAENRTHL